MSRHSRIDEAMMMDSGMYWGNGRNRVPFWDTISVGNDDRLDHWGEQNRFARNSDTQSSLSSRLLTTDTRLALTFQSQFHA